MGLKTWPLVPPVIDATVSKELQTAIDNGDVENFKRLMDTYKIPADAFLVINNRKTAFPLINRACSGKFTNNNYKGRIEIVYLLLKAGANPNVSAPYGLSAYDNVMHHLQFLDLTSANFEVYHALILLAYDIVVEYGADINLQVRDERDRVEDVLSQFYSKYYKKGAIEMLHVAYKLAEAMFERGATLPANSRVHREIEGAPAIELVEKYKNNPALYTATPQAIPAFAALLGEEKAKAALEYWAAGDKKGKALQALALLQERAFYHANWGWGPPEITAVDLLQTTIDGFDKAEKKAAVSALKKLTTPNKDITLSWTDYMKRQLEEGKRFLPMKPNYDEAIYTSLYEIVLAQA